MARTPCAAHLLVHLQWLEHDEPASHRSCSLGPGLHLVIHAAPVLRTLSCSYTGWNTLGRRCAVGAALGPGIQRASTLSLHRTRAFTWGASSFIALRHLGSASLHLRTPASPHDSSDDVFYSGLTGQARNEHCHLSCSMTGALLRLRACLPVLRGSLDHGMKRPEPGVHKHRL